MKFLGGSALGQGTNNNGLGFGVDPDLQRKRVHKDFPEMPVVVLLSIAHHVLSK